jgi:hypothetical protein
MSRCARSLPLAALVVLWCAPAAPAAPPATDGPGALSHFDELDYTIHNPVTIAPVVVP